MAKEKDKDPLDLLGTDAENEEIRKARQKQTDRDKADLKRVISFPEGRRFIWRLLSRYGLFQDPFNTNAMQMSRNCGMKASGLDLLADVNDCDENAFAQMQREHISEAKSKENSK